MKKMAKLEEIISIVILSDSHLVVVSFRFMLVLLETIRDEFYQNAGCKNPTDKMKTTTVYGIHVVSCMPAGKKLEVFWSLNVLHGRWNSSRRPKVVADFMPF